MKSIIIRLEDDQHYRLKTLCLASNTSVQASVSALIATAVRKGYLIDHEGNRLKQREEA